MKLTLGKRIGFGFIILALISAISGGLILYWLSGLTTTSQSVLSVRTPSMLGAERLMRYYGLAIGGVRGFLASGDEKYLQDFEKAKAGMQESFKALEEVSKKWVLQENKDMLKEIGNSLNKFYPTAYQAFEKRRSPDNDVATHYFNTNMAPLFKSINEKIDKEMVELSKTPATDAVRDALYYSAQYRAGTARLGMAIRAFMENADAKYLKDYETAQAMRTGGLAQLLAVSKDLSESIQENISGIAKDEAVFITHPEKIFAIRRGNDYRLDLKFLREELAPLVTVVQKNVDQIGANVSKLLDEETGKTIRLQSSMWLIAMIGVGIGIAAGAFMTIFLPMRITNLFRGMINELTTGASEVSSAAEQISSSSQCLSQATSEQAASIEETSSTMEEISSMTNQNADNASSASKLAKGCNDTVEEGNSTVVSMDSAMKDITESSGKIAEIIKIIEGIAFQTNLLALNAAVEAARAGEHGRGFAVVAEEVRNLAQRSSAAAKDITTLITDSVKKSENGMELVKSTKKVFSDVVVQVKKVADLVNEIATASEEQRNGIEQITKGVQQMDQAVQQNAATSEETASASEELAGQASQLNDLVERIADEVGRAEARAREPGMPRKRSKPSGEGGMVFPAKKVFPVSKKTASVSARGGKGSDTGKLALEAPGEVFPQKDVARHNDAASEAERLIPMSDDFKGF
ncbi:MAG: methyl-accepting chemotaxis protein [Planctomycetota bacterium]